MSDPLDEARKELKRAQADDPTFSPHHDALPWIGWTNEALRQLEAARAELASLQRFPEADWARVGALIMQSAASASRAGYQSDGQAIAKALDLGKTYVARILARADALESDLAAARVATETAERELEAMRKSRDEFREICMKQHRVTVEGKAAIAERDQYRDAEAHKHKLMVEAWVERDQARANLKEITEKLLRAEGREAALREALRPVRVAFIRDIVGIGVRDCANSKQLRIWDALDALIGDKEVPPEDEEPTP